MAVDNVTSFLDTLQSVFQTECYTWKRAHKYVSVRINETFLVRIENQPPHKIHKGKSGKKNVASLLEISEFSERNIPLIWPIIQITSSVVRLLFLHIFLEL